jgi:hypothetical protein
VKNAFDKRAFISEAVQHATFANAVANGCYVPHVSAVLECLQRLQQQNTHETARRVLRYCRQTIRYACHDLVKDLKVGRFDGGKEAPYQSF